MGIIIFLFCFSITFIHDYELIILMDGSSSRWIGYVQRECIHPDLTGGERGRGGPPYNTNAFIEEYTIYTMEKVAVVSPFCKNRGEIK